MDLDSLCQTYNLHFSSQTDYLRLLSKALGKTMEDESQKYLRIFHYLIPSLFMNFIEKTLICKDKVTKKQIDNVNLFVHRLPKKITLNFSLG